MEHWRVGKRREELELRNFESDLMLSAINDERSGKFPLFGLSPLTLPWPICVSQHAFAFVWVSGPTRLGFVCSIFIFFYHSQCISVVSQ